MREDKFKILVRATKRIEHRLDAIEASVLKPCADSEKKRADSGTIQELREFVDAAFSDAFKREGPLHLADKMYICKRQILDKIGELKPIVKTQPRLTSEQIREAMETQDLVDMPEPKNTLYKAILQRSKELKEGE